MKIQEIESEETSPVFSPSQKPTENSNDLKHERERIERDVDNPTRRMEVINHRDVEELHRLAERAKKGCFFGLCFNGKAIYQLIKKAEDISKAAADLQLAGQFPSPPPQGLLVGLKCKVLAILILHSKNHRYLKIPSSFFQGLGGLIVLDIKNIVLPSLPSSFRCLKNLRTLSLEECELEDTAMIGELVGLEVLRFVNTDISHLPEEIRQLTSLKLLCISRCINLEVIPRNVILSLKQLQELSMDESFVNWEAEGDNCQNACLSELKKLSKLTSLDIHILNSNIMPDDLFSVRLERFKILIGDGWDWSWSSKYETSQRLKLKLCTDIHLKHDVNKLLKKTEDLYLDELGGVNSVCNLDNEGFPRLRCLHVQRGLNFQYIVNSNTRVPCHIFPSLEVLSLEELKNLKMICRGQLRVESFSKLRTVKVKRCDMLKNLFSSFPIVKSLLHLQEIEVENCANMKEIVSCESEEDGRCGIVIELKQVHTLCLEFLPKITSFCSEAKIVKQKLQTVDSLGSSQNRQLIPLLNGKIVFPNLEKLVLSAIGTEKIWDNSLLAMPHCFETLRDLHVSGCNKLKFLFPIGAVTSLIQLKVLHVRDCKLMEGIIEGVAAVTIFPKLGDLKLRDLPKLKTFCKGNSIEFPSLSSMWIDKCPELKSFIFDEKEVNNDDLPPPLFDEKVELPTIESLTIWSVNLKRIWHNELAPESFCKLDDLLLHGCENLLNIFPSNMLTRLQNLRELEIGDCKSMDVIFDLEGPNALEMHITKLKSITISNCPSLRYIFPLSIGSDLQELERLFIYKCAVIDSIVATEGVVDTDVRFEFPKVTSLRLEGLPKLRSFYPGIHTSEWLLLKTLEVTGCDKLKIFASKYSNVQEGAHDEQPLFLHEKDIFPNLEKLSLSWNYWMNEMWHGEFRSETLCGLKFVEDYDLHDESITSFPPDFFEKLPNLEQLDLKSIAFEKIFPNGGVIGEAGELSTFCTLRTLRVEGCHRLKILFPPSLLSFCNLIALYVSCCKGLTYLMSSSTAKSMMQLQELWVEGCEMMTYIVECVGEGEAEDYIIFPRLEKLDIVSMPNLSSFCGSEKLAFKLPSLEYVTVGCCPNLETFCEGPLSTSKLRSLHVALFLDETVRWNGNLNTTIQTMYKERLFHANNSSVPDKSQNSRSMAFSPDRVRVKGRSAFTALASTSENLEGRNLSTPSPVVRKIYPKSVTPDSAELASTSSANAALTSSFQQPPPARKSVIPRSVKGSPEAPKTSDSNSKENSVRSRIESLTIQDVKEGEDWGGFFTHPYGNTGHPYRARPGPRQSKRLP